jgi:hypothetical protein
LEICLNICTVHKLFVKIYLTFKGGQNSTTHEVNKLLATLPPAVQALTGVDLSGVSLHIIDQSGVSLQIIDQSGVSLQIIEQSRVNYRPLILRMSLQIFDPVRHE